MENNNHKTWEQHIQELRIATEKLKEASEKLKRALELIKTTQSFKDKFKNF